jgi:RNA polymerase sigma-70 factor (ECF subfamily)
MAGTNDPSTHPSILLGLSDPSRREAAWRDFLDRYQPLMSAWCLRCGLDEADAEDVTGEVLSRLVSLMCSFKYDPRLRFRGWLKTVVTNEVRGLWRLRRRHPWDRGVGGPDGCGGLEGCEAASVEELARTLDDTMARDLELTSRALDRARARVGPRTWQAFWLTEFEGEAPVAVAEKLGMRVAALYMAKSRVLKILREEGEGLMTAGPGERGESRP